MSAVSFINVGKNSRLQHYIMARNMAEPVENAKCSFIYELSQVHEGWQAVPVRRWRYALL